MDITIEKIRKEGDLRNHIQNTPIKTLNRSCNILGLMVTVGKKGREKGFIFLKNDIERKRQWENNKLVKKLTKTCYNCNARNMINAKKCISCNIYFNRIQEKLKKRDG